MGNADLRDLAEIDSVHPTQFDGNVVAIDAHNWLYRYITGMIRWMDEGEYTTTDGVEVPNLIGMLRGLPTLLDAGIVPVFVFDGAPDELKADEIESRRADKEDAKEKAEKAAAAGNEQERKRLKARTQRLTEEIHESTRGMLEYLGIPYVDAPGAGEAQAARYAEMGVVDAAMSEDYDTLLFGSPVTIRKFSKDDDAEVMRFKETLEARGLTKKQLIDVAILCGTDYNDGVYGVGVKTALKGVKEHGDAKAFLDAKGKTVENFDEIRELFLDPAVTDEFAVDVPESVDDLDADFEGLRSYLSESWEIPSRRIDSGVEKLENATEKQWF